MSEQSSQKRSRSEDQVESKDDQARHRRALQHAMQQLIDQRDLFGNALKGTESYTTASGLAHRNRIENAVAGGEECCHYGGIGDIHGNDGSHHSDDEQRLISYTMFCEDCGKCMSVIELDQELACSTRTLAGLQFTFVDLLAAYFSAAMKAPDVYEDD